MATTFIDIINEVMTATGQRGNKTIISTNDSTAYIRDRLNDALETIYGLQPFVIDLDGTVTITPSTRTFAGPTDTELQNIHNWSLRIHDAAGDIPVKVVTEQYIIENYPGFEADEADKPRYVYLSNGLLAVYPLLAAGSSNLTLEFKYSTQFTKVTSTSATFPFEDRSDEMKFIKLSAQLDYEVYKGLGQPAVTNEKLEKVEARLKVKYAKSKRVGFTSSRRYGR